MEQTLEAKSVTVTKENDDKDAQSSLQELLSQALKFANSISNVPAVQAGIAVDMLRSGAKSLANMGKISQGEASDEKKLADMVQNALDKYKSDRDEGDQPKTPQDKQRDKERSLAEQRAEQWEEFDEMKVKDLPKWVKPGIINSAVEQEDPDVLKLYDKGAAPPRTTPPPPLEENRGEVFFPPPETVPIEFQVPPPSKDRVFTNPDPLMRSAPIVPTPTPGALPGPSTNTPGPDTEEGKRIIEAGKKAEEERARAYDAEGQPIPEELRKPVEGKEPHQPEQFDKDRPPDKTKPTSGVQVGGPSQQFQQNPQNPPKPPGGVSGRVLNK